MDFICSDVWGVREGGREEKRKGRVKGAERETERQRERKEEEKIRKSEKDEESEWREKEKEGERERKEGEQEGGEERHKETVTAISDHHPPPPVVSAEDGFSHYALTVHGCRIAFLYWPLLESARPVKFLWKLEQVRPPGGTWDLPPAGKEA